MSERVCPHCKRPYPRQFTVHGPLRQRVVDALAGIAEGLTIERLVDLVYADAPNGGPMTAAASVGVALRKASRELEAQGHRIIVSSRGRGAVYRLVATSPPERKTESAFEVRLRSRG